jgi:alkanesulfonate monooxygenase SsuD/methylene tetrahydromethanopterin reductase-like flavin-dependent oxidoreductase (luciferase family)
VKFGLFFELQLPRPWGAGAEQRLIQEGLEQIELADALGYDCAWAVEHHFMEEYSHCSAPEVFLAAASQRTKSIRLGHGVIQLTTNHPARVAERVSFLDLVSNGRVELGMGEGASQTELHPFDRRVRDKRAVWEDAVRATLPMFWNDSWEYEGEFFKVPPRNVLPKPVQKPHPPLWVACSQLDTIRMAGQWGMGALGFQFVSAEVAHRWVAAYYNAFTTQLAPLCDYQTNPNIGMVTPLMCAATDAEARAQADGWTFFQFALRYYGTHPLIPPGSVNLWEEYLSWRETPEGQKPATTGLIGSPETCRNRMRRFEGSNIDQVILMLQAGRNRHEDIMASLERFAREVMPEFKASEPAHQAWKQKVLCGDIILEEAPEAA